MLANIFSIAGLGLKSLNSRKGDVAILVLSLISVEIVFVGLLAMIQGFESTMQNSGGDDVALVIRKGSLSEVNSSIALANIAALTTNKAVAVDNGKPVASGEFYIVIELPTKRNGNQVNVPFRGIEASAFAMRPAFKLKEGRLFTPGTNEVIVGSGAAEQYKGLAIGDVVTIEASQWTVTGIFDDQGSAFESEIWCDLPTMQTTFKHEDTVQTVRVKLQSSDHFAQYKKALENDPRFEVEVVRESDYFNKQSSEFVDVIKKIGYPISILMAIGAMFSVLNTLYASISSRTTEIATLLAIGFNKHSVYFAVIFESVLLTLIGGGLGIGLSYYIVDGLTYSTMNNSAFSQIVFQFHVSWDILKNSFLLALFIGIFASFIPAFKAANLSVAKALRVI